MCCGPSSCLGLWGWGLSDHDGGREMEVCEKSWQGGVASKMLRFVPPECKLGMAEELASSAG